MLTKRKVKRGRGKTSVSSKIIHTTHPHSRGIIGIIHRLTTVIVTSCPARHAYLEINEKSDERGPSPQIRLDFYFYSYLLFFKANMIQYMLSKKMIQK